MGQEVTLVSGAARNSAAADRDVIDAPVDVARLYRAHERKVMRWAARLGGPGIDVEDVVQDVFVVAKRRLRTWDGSWNIETWLFRTTETRSPISPAPSSLSRASPAPRRAP